jgi:hypothetical protein
MKTRKFIVAASGLALIVLLTLLIGAPRTAKGLGAELVVRNADMGIPGISKVYEARLVNRAWWPIRVSRCDFVDDTLSPGRSVAYAVQRWDKNENRWTTVVEARVSNFCKPYPLGIVKARSTTAFLWPGQSLSTGDEATAAQVPFNVGDKGRFLIFVGAPGDYSLAVPTEDFVIDEHPQTDIPLRVRH